jgi:hypothetical protein
MQYIIFKEHSTVSEILQGLMIKDFALAYYVHRPDIVYLAFNIKGDADRFIRKTQIEFWDDVQTVDDTEFTLMFKPEQMSFMEYEGSPRLLKYFTARASAL